MIHVIGTVRIGEGALDNGPPAAMAAMVAATRAEDGCIAYSYAVDVLDPALVHIVERWRDRTALEAHFHAPHMAAWRASWPSLGLSGRDLKLYESDDGTPL